MGDISLRHNADCAIVVVEEYQHQHIGRRCVLNMLSLAKEKGLKEVKANLYVFKKKKKKMFESVGFKRTEEEWYCYHIVED